MAKIGSVFERGEGRGGGRNVLCWGRGTTTKPVGLEMVLALLGLSNTTRSEDHGREGLVKLMNTVFNHNECPLRLYGTVTGEFQFWVLLLLSATALPLNLNSSAVVVRG